MCRGPGEIYPLGRLPIQGVAHCKIWRAFSVRFYTCRCKILGVGVRLTVTRTMATPMETGDSGGPPPAVPSDPPVRPAGAGGGGGSGAGGGGGTGAGGGTKAAGRKKKKKAERGAAVAHNGPAKRRRAKDDGEKKFLAGGRAMEHTSENYSKRRANLIHTHGDDSGCLSPSPFNPAQLTTKCGESKPVAARQQSIMAHLKSKAAQPPARDG